MSNLELVELAGLTARVVTPADPKITCVLLHGFGAPGDDLVSLAGAYASAPVRFVFPAAPIDLGGLYGDSRAWWRLDLAALEDDMRRGRARDRRSELPVGLVEARAQVMQLLDALAVPADRLVLGGFSQGAMLSLDVALHRHAKPAGLILMSGTIIAEQEWAPRMASLAGTPIVLSHGRQDGLLPFAVAELLRDRLSEAGATVDWQPFNGGHEIPMPVLAAGGKLLARLATKPGA